MSVAPPGMTWPGSKGPSAAPKVGGRRQRVKIDSRGPPGEWDRYSRLRGLWSQVWSRQSVSANRMWTYGTDPPLANDALWVQPGRRQGVELGLGARSIQRRRITFAFVLDGCTGKGVEGLHRLDTRGMRAAAGGSSSSRPGNWTRVAQRPTEANPQMEDAT
jgi:hypothetical protein